MPLGINDDNKSKSVKDNDDKKAKKAKKSKASDDDADEAQKILDQMQAKEDNGDCAFC